jgi:predicted RNase H-like HicB family nuclease
MEIPVLIEPISGDGYRARGVEPLGLTAEGATPEEALRNLQQRIQGHLAGGVQLACLELPATLDPWLRMEGMYKEDPLYDEWQKAIAEYRREIEDDPEIP